MLWDENSRSGSIFDKQPIIDEFLKMLKDYEIALEKGGYGPFLAVKHDYLVKIVSFVAIDDGQRGIPSAFERIIQTHVGTAGDEFRAIYWMIFDNNFIE